MTSRSWPGLRPDTPPENLHMIAFDAEPRFAAATKGPNGRRLVAELREDDARFRRRVAFGLLVLAALAVLAIRLGLRAARGGRGSIEPEHTR